MNKPLTTYLTLRATRQTRLPRYRRQRRASSPRVALGPGTTSEHHFLPPFAVALWQGGGGQDNLLWDVKRKPSSIHSFSPQIFLEYQHVWGTALRASGAKVRKNQSVPPSENSSLAGLEEVGIGTKVTAELFTIFDDVPIQMTYPSGQRESAKLAQVFP